MTQPGNDGRAFITVMIAAILLMGLFLVKEACAAEPYAEAIFYRSDAWPRSNLKGHWLTMDPGTQGDSTGGLGDFETWTGTEGGCTDCPTGMTCACTTGDVDQEDIEIYRNNTSARLDVGGGTDPTITWPMDFEANAAYQITFWYRSEDGIEDMHVFVRGNGGAEYYDWLTDTWGAGAPLAIADVDTSWAMYNNGYVTVGAVAKTGDYGFNIVAESAQGTALYIDDLRVQRLGTVGVVGQLGNTLAVPVDQGPRWGFSEVMLPRVGTGPAGWWGMHFGGYLSRADDDSFDPVTWDTGGSFTIGCRVMTDTVAAGLGYVIDKYVTAGNQRSWAMTRSADDVIFYLSDDGQTGGGSESNLTASNFLGADRQHNVIVRYTYDGTDGSADVSLEVDENTPATSAVFDGPPHNSTGAMVVGAYEAGTSMWDGFIGDCVVWEGDIGAVAANKWRNPYFPGTTYSNLDGFFVDTCSQAASHATCSSQVCRDGTPNACQAEGTGVMAAFGQHTELLENNSFETITGGDDNPAFTDWSINETAGNGTARVTAYRADKFHGNISARLTTTGSTSQAWLNSPCVTATPSATYRGEVMTRKFSGTANLRFRLAVYTDGACGSYAGASYFHAGDISEVWDLVDSWYAVGGTINSVKLSVISEASIADFIVDRISLKEERYTTPWVHSPSGAGSTTYTARDYRLDSPLDKFIEEEQAYGYEDGFCASAWLYTDWSADSTAHVFLHVPGTSGTNNRIDIHQTAGNALQCAIYDSAGAVVSRSLTATSANWTAGFFKFVECCSDNTGTVNARHYDSDTGNWYSWSTAVNTGTGIQDGQSDELHVGHRAGLDFLDGHIPRIDLAPYDAIYPNEGFDECVNLSIETPY